MLTHSFIFLLNNEECIKTKGKKTYHYWQASLYDYSFFSSNSKKVFSMSPYQVTCMGLNDTEWFELESNNCHLSWT